MEAELTYAQYINRKMIEYVESLEYSVFFGQNVISGSRISGLGAGMDKLDNVLGLNTQNSENSLFGFGFGLSIMGVPSTYLMKQHDFVLLAIDHLVNTRRLLQNTKDLSSFVTVMVVVDSGFEGPQSNLNNLDDLYSLSGCKIWLLNSKSAIDLAFSSKREEFEIFAISQSNLRSPLPLDEKSLIEGGFSVTAERSMTQDSNPVLVNFGLGTQAFNSCVDFLLDQGMVFHVARQVEMNLEKNLKFLQTMALQGRKFIIVDSSKSRNRLSHQVVIGLLENRAEVLYISRHDSDFWKQVNDDQFVINQQSVLEFVRNVKDALHG